MKEYEVIIIGAGPAGVACAYTLYKNNIDCLLIDKENFPREKLCAGGLSSKSYELLDMIFDDLKYEYTKVNSVRVNINKTRFDLMLKKELRFVERKDFDYELLKKYQGDLLLNTYAKEIIEKDSHIELLLSNGLSYKCKYLIGADGSLSKVRKLVDSKKVENILCLECNIDRKIDYFEIHFNNEVGAGYFYLSPNVRNSKSGYGNLNTDAKWFENKLATENVGYDKIKGAFINMAEGVNYPFKKNILLVGDAGGYVNNLTGEGLYYALQSGYNAALAIINNADYKKLNKRIIKKINRYNKVFKIFIKKEGIRKIAFRIGEFKLVRPILTYIGNRLL